MVRQREWGGDLFIGWGEVLELVDEDGGKRMSSPAINGGRCSVHEHGALAHMAERWRGGLGLG